MSDCTYARSPSAALALTRLRLGLTRHRNGWASLDPSADPRDLINFLTVNALERHGLCALSPDRQQAFLQPPQDTH